MSRISLIWFGAAISIAEILTGACLESLGLGRGLAVIVLGHLIGFLLLVLAGIIFLLRDTKYSATYRLAGYNDLRCIDFCSGNSEPRSYMVVPDHRGTYDSMDITGIKA